MIARTLAASNGGIDREAGAHQIAFNARQDPINGPINGPINTDGTTNAICFQSKQSSTSQGPSFDHLAPSLDTAKAGGTATLQAMKVRRLTPLECARLQGVPDAYLDITMRNKSAADGPKYKALGNSWAVPVVAWIARRIECVSRPTEIE